MCRFSNFEPKTEKFKSLVKYLKKYGNEGIGITLVFKIKKESDNKYLIDGEPIKKKHLVYFEDIEEDGFPEYRLHKSLEEIVNPRILLPKNESRIENKTEEPEILLGDKIYKKSWWTTLKFGIRDKNIEYIKLMVNKILGSSLKIDNKFDEDLLKAIKTIKIDNNRKCSSGKIDFNTLVLVNELVGENKPKIVEVDPIIEDEEELSPGPLYIVDRCLEKFKTNELFMQCFYNIYQYKGEIYVVGNYDYEIERYGYYFINKVNKLLGL